MIHHLKEFFIKNPDQLFKYAEIGDKLIFDNKGSYKEGKVLRALCNHTLIKFDDSDKIVIDRNTFKSFSNRNIRIWLSKRVITTGFFKNP